MSSTDTGKSRADIIETPIELAERVSTRLAALEDIHLPFPRQERVMAEFEMLRQIGLKTRGKRQRGVTLIEPSGSGKTQSAVRYAANVQAREKRDDDSQPVLIVPLETTGTTKSLFASILSAIGDPFAAMSTEATLKMRVIAALTRERTQLLIIDEVQHLIGRSGARAVTDTLKRFLDDGLVPIAFLGTGSAKDLFAHNPELKMRLMAPLSLPKMSADHANDRRLFERFCHHLDKRLVQTEIMKVPSALDDSEVVDMLMRASDGTIGRLMAIIKTAAREALMRNDDAIMIDDLALAVERWAVAQDFLDSNPFDERQVA